MIRKKHLNREGPAWIVADLDSHGGSYLEGIALGRLFHNNGYGTLVKAQGHCYSAAAFAFLGGSFLDAVSLRDRRTGDTRKLAATTLRSQLTC